MTTTEQRVAKRIAKAIDATAQQVTAESIPPFRVSDAAPRFAGRPLPARGVRRWSRLLVPAAVAASVALVAVAAVLAGNNVASHRPPMNPASGQVPPYYAALRYEHPFTSHLRVDVTIRSTATGKVLATVPPLAGGFAAHMVSAAADDRTFVMAASRLVPDTSNSVPVRFYLIRFDPATDTVAVRGLPISDVTANGSAGLFEIGLSPDGQRLAVMTDTFRGIRVYSVPGGAQRAWTTSVASELLSPAWAGGSRQLAFFYRPLDLSAHEVGLRLLDTASSKHDLLAASRKPPVLLRYECGPAWFAPRPSMIACVIENLHHGTRTAYVAEVSLRTGKLLRRLPLPPPGVVPDGAVPQVAWANPAGTKAIVIISQLRPRPSGSASAYLVTSGRITKIPGATWAGTVNIYLPASW
jgi:hypothetical protein